MQKSFCDLCEEELTNDTFVVNIQRLEERPDPYLPSSRREVYVTHHFELCRECNENIYQFILGQKKNL